MRVLVVDDDRNSRELLAMSLGKTYDVDSAVNGVQAVEMLKVQEYDVIVCDLVMNDIDGFDVLSELKKVSPNGVFILITAFGTGDIAIKAIQRGAYEYISKPFKMKQLKEILRQLEKRFSVTRKEQPIPQQEWERTELIANSAVFLETLKNMARIAATDVPVLITGESGTGKEVISRAIHEYSTRTDRPFVGVNCTAIPSSLLESELFGYEKGAFTGATVTKKGYFEQAQRGSLFLDEIGDLSLDLQVKLLRVLQESQVRRLGGKEDINLNVRFIFATNADLGQKVQAGEFRSDLYYRLKVSALELAPLRERREDIIPLAQLFIKKHTPAGSGEIILSRKTETALLEYPFPGNVRELENMIRSAIIQAKQTGVIMPEDLSISPHDKQAETPPAAEVTPERIREALERTGGKKAAAAKLLGVSRATLYRMIDRNEHS